jgi:predicted GIY-YIG superfamily endonuclease
MRNMGHQPVQVEERKSAMKTWLYILRCADGSYYTGSTDNLPLRLAQHEAGEGCDYTRHRLPVELVFAEAFPSEQQASLRERQVRGWSRAKKEALIRGDWDALVRLSRARSPAPRGDDAEEQDKEISQS